MRTRRLGGLLSVAALVLALAACGPTTETAPGALPPVSASPSVPAPVPATKSPSVRAPNVMVVMMDDMRWDELRFAPKTRRFLADRGLTFQNSFAPFPLCCPARASFMTGLYAHNHGVLSHLAPYGFGAFDDRVSIGTHLQKAGYRTALVGKYLNGYGPQPSLVTGESSVGYVPRGWTDWMVGLDNGGGISGSTYDYFNFTQNVNGDLTFNSGRYSSRVIADQVIGLIDKYTGADDPFFMWVTPVAPHHGSPVEPDDPSPEWHAPYNTPARPDWVKGRFDDTITHAPGLPASGADPEARINDKPRFMRMADAPTDSNRTGTLAVARQRAESIYAWDVQFGRIVKELKRTGQFDDTVLMFTSDNGYMLGEHRVLAGKIYPHEPSLRVPLLVTGPGVKKGERFHPATTMDLTATVLDLAGAQQMRRADGASLWPVMTGADRPWTWPILTEGYFPDLPRKLDDFPALTEIGLRTGQYKYVRWATDQEELYDLRADPNELRSLHRKPRHAALLARFRQLWEDYEACRARACRDDLPADLQVSPADLARIDSNFDRQRRSYYGSPTD